MPLCGACGDEHLSDDIAGPRFCPRTGDPIGAVGPCGTQIDRYRVSRWIGGGGLGAVYRARHAILGHEVALKLLHPRLAHDADVVGRFVREARAAASIESPHIVRVMDIGTSPEGRPFLAMELLEGQDLASLIVEQAPLPAPRVVAIALQLLEGLAIAHAAGIVHRDLKPANLFLTGPPGQEIVKILDFGVSKILSPEPGAAALTRTALTRTGMVIGTPQYMSPEQGRADRDIDARADLYSTGVILYQMISGALPHMAESGQELLVKLSSTAPPPLARIAPGAPDALIRVIERAMEPDRQRRWASASEMAAALGAATIGKSEVIHHRPEVPATRGMAAPGPQAPQAPRAPSATRPSPWLLALPAALGMLILASGALLWLGTRSTNQVPGAGLVALPPPASPPMPFTPDPENSPQVAALAMRSLSLPAAPAPTPPKTITFGEPSIRGQLAAAAVRGALERALPSLDACRAPARHERVRLQIALLIDGRLERQRFLGNEADRVPSGCAFDAVARTWNVPPVPKGATLWIEIFLSAR